VVTKAVTATSSDKAVTAMWAPVIKQFKFTMKLMMAIATTSSSGGHHCWDYRKPATVRNIKRQWINWQ